MVGIVLDVMHVVIAVGLVIGFGVGVAFGLSWVIVTAGETVVKGVVNTVDDTRKDR